MTDPLSQPPSGNRVVIIGGGPGGTACALALQRLAAEMGRHVQILLLEGKQFAEERHYNQCVGVLSPPLSELLEKQLGVPFPDHLSRGSVPGYVLHVVGQQITLEDAESSALTLRRVQFDAYMLEAVRQRGIQVLPARAVDLEFHADRVIVYTENAPVEGDVVVGAFGLDAGSATMFSRAVSYRPPQELSSVVTKYHPGPEGMAAFGPYIHVFLPPHPQIEFGAITPKGNHLTINIAGRAVDANLMQAFLHEPMVQSVLPSLPSASAFLSSACLPVCLSACLSTRQADKAGRQADEAGETGRQAGEAGERPSYLAIDRLRLTRECAGSYDRDDLRFFKGRFPCSLARDYYGDRYVMVGDAAGLVRAFKGKGVTSAVQTGIRAAETILQAGITEQAFQEHYRTANQDIISDLPYGRGMRLLTIRMARYGLMGAVLRAAQQDPAVRSALFNAVSAHGSYRQVLAQMTRPRPLLAILRELGSTLKGRQLLERRL